MKTIIARCKEKHGHIVDIRSILPSRLLDVTLKRPRLIRLADVTATLSELKYAALSYCWGAPNEATQQLKTTKDSIAGVTVCALTSSSCLQGFLYRSKNTVRIPFQSHVRFGLEGVLHL
jgi:hypothetical protein